MSYVEIKVLYLITIVFLYLKEIKKIKADNWLLLVFQLKKEEERGKKN